LKRSDRENNVGSNTGRNISPKCDCIPQRKASTLVSDKDVHPVECTDKTHKCVGTDPSPAVTATSGLEELETIPCGALATPEPGKNGNSASEMGRMDQASDVGVGCSTSLPNPTGLDSGNRLLTPVRLQLKPRNEVWAVNRSLKLPKNAPCCRYPITVQEVVLESCIDSGATICLMSRKAYDKIKTIVGPLQPTSRKASGASGADLNIDGWVQVPFKIGLTTYTYSFLVGTLSGVDCLLGLDWLQTVGAVIDFASMRAEFGPKEIVQLSSEPLEINFCSVPIGQTLMARCHTRVRCKATWVPKVADGTAMFEPTAIKLGPGLTIGSSIVKVDPQGYFYTTIQNETTQNWDIPDEILLGRLEEIQIDPMEDTNRSPQRFLNHCIWQVAEQRSKPLSVAEEYLKRPTYVAGSLVRDREIGDLPGSSVPSVKHCVRVNTGKGSDCSPSPPESVKYFDIYGVEIKQEDLADAEFFESSPETQDCAREVLLMDPSTVSELSPDQIYATEEKAKSKKSYPSGAGVERLPEHLRCVLPPPGTLAEHQLNILVELILEYQDVFVGPDGKVGFNTLVQHRIDTGDAQPFKSHPRKKSEIERDYIAQEVKNLLDKGYIRPSMSPWGAPVVLAKKKDGTLRFCVDFRKLNEMTKKDAYPLPRIEECLDSLNGSKYFSTMDLASGYWQVAMEAESKEKTAFTTHVGLFEWNVLPFGLCNAPATFCRMMEMVLADIVWKNCLVYLDDVIAFGDSFRNALNSLRAVFARLRKHNLKLKAKKCEFFRTEVEYLGHEVGQQGLRPSMSKIQALHDWRIPEDLTQLKSFLGFTSFYRRYIRNYSALAQPLTEKTKGKRAWTPLDEKGIQAFRSIIDALSRRVLLHYIQPRKDFYLTTDASNYAIGAALEQVQNGERVPIAFASKTLEESRVHYCATKKELYAIVFFMRYFRGFYRGRHVWIETDHYALQWLFNFTDVDSMYQRWITEMSQYDPWEVVYIRGKDNLVADALSRRNPPKSVKPYRDCKIRHCEICSYHFRKVKRCKGTDSPSDSSSDEDDDPDHPDHQDYATWDLCLVRSGQNPLVYSALAVTRNQSRKQIENRRSNVQPPRRSERIAAKRAEIAEKRAESSSSEEPSPVERKRTHRNRVRRAKYKHSKRMVRKVLKNLRRMTSEVGEESSNQETPQENEAPISPPVESSSEFHDGPKLPPQVSSTPADVESGEEDSGYESSNLDREEELALSNLKAVLECYSDNDWIRAQKNDLVISRLKALLRIFPERPKSDDVKGETPEIQGLLVDWYAFEFEDNGILCRRVRDNDSATLDEGHLQRLVPAKWRLEMWKHMHGTECRHLSFMKVYTTLTRHYFWYGISNDLLDWGRACLKCQKSKRGIGKGLEHLKQEFTSHRNERVAMDLVGVLPETARGNHYVLIMQDYYTKWVELTAIPNKKAITVAWAMLSSYIAHWGCPENLHSDQGNEFDAEVIQEVYRLWGIRKTRTTPFNPSSNGMVERSNRTMKSLFRAMAKDRYRTTWDEKLPLVMIAMNLVVHSTTGFAPFRLQVAGNEDMRVPGDLIFGVPNPVNRHCYYDFVFQQKLAMQEISEIVRQNIYKAMAIQRAAREKGPLKIRRYQSGDLVLRWYPPHAAEKLRGDPFTGPYEIVEVDPDNLIVKLRDLKSKGRGVEDKWIHVSSLKPVIRTKDGKLLCEMENGLWEDLPDARDLGVGVPRPVPAIAEFTD